MTALEPGLYRATVRGVADQTVMLSYSSSSHPWTSVEICGGYSTHGTVEVTDARPLIVLEAPEAAPANHYPRFVAFLRRNGWDFTADQIEAQTPPARIPEPGLWGVVEAGADQRIRQPFLRDNLKTNVGSGWVSIYGPPETEKRRVEWADLIDPTLIREGVES